MMTVRIEFDGTLVWYRTDSFWDLYSSVISSSWGPSIKLSTSSESNVDNNGATDLGKTYVFALSDGSGVQLSHIAYSIYGPTTYSTAGTGVNTVVTAPSKYYNDFIIYEANYCSDTNLHLAGTADTSELASVVKNYSDGYYGILTITMD